MTGNDDPRRFGHLPRSLAISIAVLTTACGTPDVAGEEQAEVESRHARISPSCDSSFYYQHFSDETLTTRVGYIRCACGAPYVRSGQITAFEKVFIPDTPCDFVAQ
ncbi:hypothetical protein [Myxococcus faecalis]|uniref:hypothetical protein n=1 Tax=Myxococcus faecalis TaxID=3115646 RepID=UPI003CED7573